MLTNGHLQYVFQAKHFLAASVCAVHYVTWACCDPLKRGHLINLGLASSQILVTNIGHNRIKEY